MKILKYIGIVVGVLFAAFAITSLILPNEVGVERSITIDAPKSVVYPQVASFENFSKWNPWSKFDENMKTGYEGEQGTVGSKYTWESTNENVGTGWQSITAMTEDQIDITLAFTAPWESTSDVYYKFAEEDGKTTVSWGYKGEVGFGEDVMMMMMGMEEQIGSTYDEGLASLKTICEELPSEEVAEEVMEEEMMEEEVVEEVIE